MVTIISIISLILICISYKLGQTTIHKHDYDTPITRVGTFDCYKCEKCGHTIYKDHKPKKENWLKNGV